MPTFVMLLYDFFRALMRKSNTNFVSSHNCKRSFFFKYYEIVYALVSTGNFFTQMMLKQQIKYFSLLWQVMHFICKGM
jgi:hypothetical protein